jgi:hypothetical protein
MVKIISLAYSSLHELNLLSNLGHPQRKGSIEALLSKDAVK